MVAADGLRPSGGSPRVSVDGWSPSTSEFGDHDAYVLCELPDNRAAAAIALAVGAAGGATTRTVVLLTPADVDEATKQAVAYRPPGA